VNVLIGKNGFIAKKLLERGKYVATTSEHEDTDTCLFLDLKDASNFDYNLFNENTNIIFLAAISSPDVCNNDYSFAYKINVEGTALFIEKSIERGANILFFSSDVVYGNRTEEVDENAKTNPFGKYAEMKDIIEKKFANEKKFKVFRLSYVLSNEDKFLKYLQHCIDQHETAEIFHPFSRKVVYINDVLEAIESILKKWDQFPNQKFNICGVENISRKQLAEWYNLGNANLLKYTIVEPSEDFWKARPKDINIVSNYLSNIIGHQPTSIHEAIKQITRRTK